MNPFMDLATALGQKVASLVTTRGVQTPAQRPVSTSGDSFDFAANVRKLLEPVTNVFTPKSGVGILEGAAATIVPTVFDSLGRNLSSSIDKLFGNSNKMPSVEAREETNVTLASDPFGSQLQSLGEAFKLFSQIKEGNPAVTPAASVPQSNNTMLWLVGGAVALGAVLIVTTRRAE